MKALEDLNRPIYLHIGLHKTGTTFLQNKIFTKIKNINYISGKNIYNITGSYDVTLISNEAISGLGFKGLKEPYIKQLINSVRRLKQTFRHPKLIIGLREPSSLINSFYKQYLQIGGTLNFKDFKRENNEVLKKGDLTAFLDELTNLYGKENFFIYFQEDLRNKPDVVIKSLLNFMELKDCNIKIEKESSINKSLPDNLEKTLIFLNKTNKIFNGKLNNYFFRKLNLTPRLFCQNLLPKFIKSKSQRNLNDIRKNFEVEWLHIKNEF